MTRHRSFATLVLALALALPLALAGCRIGPSSGKKRASAPSAAVSKPQDSGGTQAAAVAGAPVGWVAAPGVVVAAQPDDGAWAGYVAAGYRTVVNFRPSSEGADRERDWVAANGMQYFHLPVVGPAVTWADADALAKILGDGNNRNVLLHCSSGNRAAGVWALYQARYHGLSKDAAIAEARRVAPLKPAVAQRIAELIDAE